MDTTHPGIFLDEIPGAPRPIEGVSTSNTAFLGLTEKGPLKRALAVSSFAEFEEQYGSFSKNSFLAHSALQFFSNGGKHLYIARVTDNENAAPEENDYRRAFDLLDPIKDINLIAVPGIATPSMVNFGADYCRRRRDCFFIGDMSATDQITEAQTFMGQLNVENSYAAVYFPWPEIKDPSGASSQPVKIPPSGSVAGVYARTDASRGVWKAPAGVEATIRGAVRLSVDVSEAEQDILHPIGVNVIRKFSDTGIVIWGARTITNDPDLRFVPTRRLMIFLEQSISRGIEWAATEPNDESLWSRLRRDISDFLILQWHAGALQGIAPKEAFFVRCDRTTMTQSDIDAGNLNVLVGVAPLKPAEFVIIRIGHWAEHPPAP